MLARLLPAAEDCLAFGLLLAAAGVPRASWPYWALIALFAACRAQARAEGRALGRREAIREVRVAPRGRLFDGPRI